MKKANKQIDVYIQKAAEFAQPVLMHFRKLVHEACPDVEETIKWGMPHFDYKGSMMCHMAAFKKHCAFGFHKAELMGDSKNLLAKAKTQEAMGHFGKITSLKDLPKDSILIKYIKEAAKLNEEGIKLPSKTKSVISHVEVPDYFMTALKKNKKAITVFEKFSNSNKKEYVQWVTEAKTETTKLKRLTTAIEWMSEGKIRNWKYVK